MTSSLELNDRYLANGFNYIISFNSYSNSTMYAVLIFNLSIKKLSQSNIFPWHSKGKKCHIPFLNQIMYGFKFSLMSHCGFQWGMPSNTVVFYTWHLWSESREEKMLVFSWFHPFFLSTPGLYLQLLNLSWTILTDLSIGMFPRWLQLQSGRQ